MDIDRFSTMEGQGINTNDATATASDVAKGKTAYAKGSKIVGTAEFGGGIDFDSLGSRVGVEAQESVSVGDRFVGEANTSGATSQIVRTSIGVTFNVISDDNSVGIVNQTLSEENNQLKIYFLNDDGAYEPKVFEISQSKIDGAITYLGTKTLAINPHINEDGTLACCVIINGAKCSIIILSIGKSSKTLDFGVINNPSIDYFPTATGYTYNNDWHITAGGTFFVSNDYLCLQGYTISGTRIQDSTGTSTSVSAYVKIWFRCGTNTLTQNSCSVANNYDQYKTRTYSNGVVLVAYFTSNNRNIIRVDKYIDSGGSLTFSLSGIFNVSVSGGDRYIVNIWMSRNGKYLGVRRKAGTYKEATYFLSLDIETMEIKQILSVNSEYNAVPTDSGTLWWYSRSPAGIYELDNGAITSKYSGGALPTNGKLNINRWISGGTAYNVSPSSNASYLIKKMNVMTTESGKIYGVCNENIAAGFTGTAIKMFST